MIVVNSVLKELISSTKYSTVVSHAACSRRAQRRRQKREVRMVRENKKKKRRGIDHLDKACGCYSYLPCPFIPPVGVWVIGKLL